MLRLSLNRGRSSDSSKSCLSPFSQKTIFIAVEDGFSSRYLLRTDIFKVLKSSGVRIVILAPTADEKYFRDEFGGDNVFFERFESEKCDDYLEKSLFQKFLKNVRLYTANNGYPINFTKHWYAFYRKNRPHHTLIEKFHNCLFDSLVFLLGRLKFLRRLEIYLEGIFFPGNFHKQLFLKYQPDILLTTSLGNLQNSQYIMREARKYGTKAVSTILSWDNPTTKGMAGALADNVVAWTETMKQELVHCHDIKPKKIFVGGVAHFDVYFHHEQLMTRKRLFEQYGLSDERKLIFLCLMSPTQFAWNSRLIEIIGKAISDESFDFPCQLLVRFHPIYFRIQNGKMKFKKDIEQLMSIKDKYPHIHYDIPDVLSRTMSYDMPASEMRKVGSILKHTDVLLSFFSSMMIEASIFQTPVINAALYPKNNIPTEVIIAHNHIKRILDTGGVRTAYTEQQLKDTINLYLHTPEQDREGRQEIQNRETVPFQGNAGERIGYYIQSLLKE